MPPPIQRFAPFTSTPTNGTSARQARKKPAPISAARRAVAIGSIETNSISGTDSATHTSWRQK